MLSTRGPAPDPLPQLPELPPSHLPHLLVPSLPRLRVARHDSTRLDSDSTRLDSTHLDSTRLDSTHLGLDSPRLAYRLCPVGRPLV